MNIPLITLIILFASELFTQLFFLHGRPRTGRYNFISAFFTNVFMLLLVFLAVYQ